MEIVAKLKDLKIKEIRMKRKIQGPVLSANVEGLTNSAAPTQKSVVTGFSRLSSSILPFKDGQVEIANSCCYCVGNVRGVSAHNGKLDIQMSENIFGRGYPPPWWKTSLGGEFLDDLGDYSYTYIGPGEKGGSSRLFIQSACPGHCGLWSITLFPPNGKLLDPLTIDNLRAMRMRGGQKSVTVLPPPQDVDSSWWRPRPWLSEDAGTLPLSFA